MEQERNQTPGEDGEAAETPGSKQARKLDEEALKALAEFADVFRQAALREHAFAMIATVSQDTGGKPEFATRVYRHGLLDAKRGFAACLKVLQTKIAVGSGNGG